MCRGGGELQRERGKNLRVFTKICMISRLYCWIDGDRSDVVIWEQSQEAEVVGSRG